MNNNFDKLKMHVPDRIVVAGHGRHVGVPALPRELELDSAVGMPPDPLKTRIHMPPRSITVTESLKSTLGSGSEPSSQDTSDGEDETFPTDSGYPVPVKRAHGGNHSFGRSIMESPGKNDFMRNGDTSMDRRIVENNTLGAYEEEVEHLRDQLSRVNRRVMILEEEMTDRKDKERYLVIAGILYAAVRAVNWLFRSRR